MSVLLAVECHDHTQPMFSGAVSVAHDLVGWDGATADLKAEEAAMWPVSLTDRLRNGKDAVLARVDGGSFPGIAAVGLGSNKRKRHRALAVSLVLTALVASHNDRRSSLEADDMELGMPGLKGLYMAAIESFPCGPDDAEPSMEKPASGSSNPESSEKPAPGSSSPMVAAASSTAERAPRTLPPESSQTVPSARGTSAGPTGIRSSTSTSNLVLVPVLVLVLVPVSVLVVVVVVVVVVTTRAIAAHHWHRLRSRSGATQTGAGCEQLGSQSRNGSRLRGGAAGRARGPRGASPVRTHGPKPRETCGGAPLETAASRRVDMRRRVDCVELGAGETCGGAPLQTAASRRVDM